jgi:hypothetical protein
MGHVKNARGGKLRHEFLLTNKFDPSAAATQLAFSPAEVVS